MRPSGFGEVIISDIARNDGHGENTPYFDGWKAYKRDPYEACRNPNGVIQMGLAENQICFDLIEEWIKKNPRASICTPEGVNDFKETAIFQDYFGLPQFRETIAKFMSRVRGGRVRFDPERIVMGGGATGANETLMFCLANPGDAFLLPAPYYPPFVRDLCWRTGVKIFLVPCESSNDFLLTIQALEKAYHDAENENINIRGLIITNPWNPLGTTFDRQTLETLVHFVHAKRIHLVCDEIYAATVFDSPAFTTVADLISDEEAQVDKNLIHIVYSLSKDMGLPGLRVGIVYSYNDAVVVAARRMSSFGLVSSQTQRLIANMLGDGPFVAAFLAESSRRLTARRRRFVDGLAGVGVGCLRSNSGLFLWMDLRRLLAEPTFEGEMGLWRVVLEDVRLNVSPGSSFCCPEPGWFRICFANMDDDTVEVALQRIKDFFGEELKSTENKKKKQRLVTALPTVVPPSPLVEART